MLKKTKLLSHTVILANMLLVGCSSLKKKEEAQKSQVLAPIIEKHQTSPLEDTMEEASKRLNALIDQAKVEGGQATTFLASDIFLKANDASMRGDSHMATFLFTKLMELAPEDMYVKRKLAIELIRVGRLNESKQMLEELFAQDEKDETIGLLLGGIHTALEEKEAAQKVYKRVLKKNPGSEEACVFLAKSYGLDKKFKTANQLLIDCEKRGKDKAIFSYYRGKLSIVQGDYDTALKHFSKSLKVNPKYYQAAVAKGLIYEEREQFKKAIAIYKTYLKEDPNSYPVLSRVVQVMFAAQEYDGIIEYAERLSSLDTSDLNLKVRLGILYTDAKRYDDAIGLFKEILVAVPSSDKVLYYLGSLYQQLGKYDDAIVYFNRIPTSSSLFHDSNLQMAEMLHVMAKDDVEKGADQNIGRFVAFVKDKSGKFEALRVDLAVILSTFYESTNKYREAVDTLALVRSEKGYNEGHDYYLASLYEKINDFESSEKLIREILVKNPENALALNFLGYSLLDRGENLELAYEYISKAVKLKPNDGYIRDSLGWYYYKTGKLNQALREVKRAWELVKTDVVITKHLAEIYLALKRYKDARKYFVEALKNCKFESERQEVQDALDKLESERFPASR